MPAHVTALYRYPVKGLPAEPLSRVAVVPSAPLPLDRAWAIENGPGRFDAASPRHVPKTSFLMLMRNERLATLESRFDEETSMLTISRGGKVVASGNLMTTTGRQVIEQFMAAYMKDDLRGPPRIVEAPGHSFSDVAAKCLHIVNLASVRELERVAGRSIDPLRFRPNILIDGATPWQEFDWVGRQICAGDARLEVFKRTERCAATNVDPATGARDMDLPAQLALRWGHTDFGVYAKVVAAGTVTSGDRLELIAGR